MATARERAQRLATLEAQHWAALPAIDRAYARLNRGERHEALTDEEIDALVSVPEAQYLKALPTALLDAILEAHLVEGLDRAALLERGFAAAVVDDVLRRVRISEYKRRQMPPGLKITGKAFGPGRRVPIARAPD